MPDSQSRLTAMYLKPSRIDLAHALYGFKWKKCWLLKTLLNARPNAIQKNQCRVDSEGVKSAICRMPI